MTWIPLTYVIASSFSHKTLAAVYFLEFLSPPLISFDVLFLPVPPRSITKALVFSSNQRYTRARSVQGCSLRHDVPSTHRAQLRIDWTCCRCAGLTKSWTTQFNHSLQDGPSYKWWMYNPTYYNPIYNWYGPISCQAKLFLAFFW